MQVPVTADIESGFSADVQALEQAITEVIKAGAVGVNLEDLFPKAKSTQRYSVLRTRFNASRLRGQPVRNLEFIW